MILFQDEQMPLRGQVFFNIFNAFAIPGLTVGPILYIATLLRLFESFPSTLMVQGWVYGWLFFVIWFTAQTKPLVKTLIETAVCLVLLRLTLAWFDADDNDLWGIIGILYFWYMYFGIER